MGRLNFNAKESLNDVKTMILRGYLLMHTDKKWVLGAKELTYKGCRVWFEQDFYNCIHKYKRKHTQIFMVSIEFHETRKAFLKT
jgi:hypothetical protein